MGAGLPAGEAIIAAVMTAFMEGEAERAVASASQAIEMEEWGPMSQDQLLGRSGSGVTVLSGREAVQQSQPVKDFLAFLDRALTALERGTDPTLLRP